MAGQRRDLGLAREAIAAVAALALGLIVVARLAASDRGVLLLSDGDSLITVLVARSLQSGEPQDWAMSSVLFIPEIAVYSVLSLLGLPIMATLVLNALVNLLAFYAALRFVTRSADAALAGLAGFSVLALLEHSASRESLEIASLLATTTYYSSTVIGVLLTIGLLTRRGRVPLAVLGAVALVCTITNPIYLAWAVVPLCLLLLVPRVVPWQGRLAAVGVLAGGAGLGLLVRIPLAPWIANTGAGYVQPSNWIESLSYYGDLVAGRVQDAAGVVAVLVWGILLVLAMVLTIVAARRGEWMLAQLATVAWAVPVMTVVGAIALGTHAARYLQPAVFLPPLALAVLVALLGPAPRLVLPAVAAGLSVIAAVCLPPLVQSASRQHPNADVACVTDWVEQSGRVGAGQFWAVRAPKAYAADPAQLVQVDLQLNAYAWLVNREDFAVGEVSFLLNGPESFPFELPAELSTATMETVRCGVYTITDFRRPIVTLGPPHS